jgi:hypothetical protein
MLEDNEEVSEYTPDPDQIEDDPEMAVVPATDWPVDGKIEPDDTAAAVAVDAVPEPAERAEMAEAAEPV